MLLVLLLPSTALSPRRLALRRGLLRTSDRVRVRSVHGLPRRLWRLHSERERRAIRPIILCILRIASAGSQEVWEATAFVSRVDASASNRGGCGLRAAAGR